ncbi:DNA helicase, partial [Tanacetum coccineum]
CVAGSRQYDLPTSQTLGGIVFQSFYPEIQQHGVGEEKRVSMNMFYIYQLHERANSYGLLFRGGRLLQKYVVGVYCCIEQNGMDFYRTHQSDIRKDYLSGIYDALSRGDREGNSIEIKRHMNLYPDMLPGDRADVVVRVFQQKVQEFCKFLKDSRLFETVTGLLYIIEFQKRGLPHCHTLLWVDNKDKIQRAEDIDQYISAELPDLENDPQGYMVVSEMMVHGPCGLTDPSAPCELFYLRMLLCPQKVCQLFEDIRTINNRLYSTFRDPKKLWSKYWRRMSDDISRTTSKSLRISQLHINNPELEQYALFKVEIILKSFSKSLEDFGLPTISRDLLDELRNRELMEEKSYNREELAQEIVLAVASSGIASLLLPSGWTAHSRFKLPLELTDESICKIKKNTHAGTAQTDVIIWDKSPMNDHRCFETQTLPVKKGVSKPEIISSSIAESYLWNSFTVCSLKEICACCNQGPVNLKRNWHEHLPHGFLISVMATLESQMLKIAKVLLGYEFLKNIAYQTTLTAYPI